MKPAGVIKKGYLRNFLLLLLTVLFAGTVMSALTLYLDIYRPLNTHYSAVLSTIAEIKESLVIKTIKINALFYLLTTSGIGLLVILYTHRIAGPLYRIKQHARSIAEGNLGAEVKFRRKDAVNSLAESLNDMTKNYSDKVAMLASEIQRLKGFVTELKSLTEKGEDTEAIFKKIIELDNKIKNLLGTIKL